MSECPICGKELGGEVDPCTCDIDLVNAALYEKYVNLVIERHKRMAREERERKKEKIRKVLRFFKIIK